MPHLLAHWIGVAAMVGVASAFALPAEFDAHREFGRFHALDPVEVVVDRGDTGQRTGVYALAVIEVTPGTVVFDPPSPVSQFILGQQARFSAGVADFRARSARMSAWTAALETIGVNAPHGLLVTGSTSPPLRQGDVIIEVNGRPVTRLALDGFGSGLGARLAVIRDDSPVTVDVPPGYRFGGAAQLEDVGAAPGAPRVRSLDGYGGASAGLAIALGYLQVLTGAGITGGRAIAATGILVPTGAMGVWRVLAVGSVGPKAASAARAGFGAVLVPAFNAAEASLAVEATGARTQIVPVDTLAAAIGWLRLHGGTTDLQAVA